MQVSAEAKRLSWWAYHEVGKLAENHALKFSFHLKSEHWKKEWNETEKSDASKIVQFNGDQLVATFDVAIHIE